MFTKEIEEALADGRVDLAVHSLKDLPTELSAASKSRPSPSGRIPGCLLLGPPQEHRRPSPGSARGHQALRRSTLKALMRDRDIAFVCLAAQAAGAHARSLGKVVDALVADRAEDILGISRLVMAAISKPAESSVGRSFRL